MNDIHAPAPLRWVGPLTASTDSEMAAEGLHRVRTLFQMRCELPLASEVIAATMPIRTEPFDRATDAEEFLEVNNRAFHWHPEQGGWDLARLEEVLEEDWFDPSGFLIHREKSAEPPSGRIDGFCWTKVHPADPPEPAMGEIFAIAVDPVSHRSGLGRALTVAGLQHLHGEGVHTGMLYVEHDNGAAVGLYESLGFRVHERHGGYR